MISIFDINVVAFVILGYSISWVELIGTIFGFACVWLTAKEKVSSWPIGLVNVVFFFILFYQIRLYSDMALQVFFLFSSLYGWWAWTHPSRGLENKREELKISKFNPEQRGFGIVSISLLTYAVYYFVKDIHIHFPNLFPEPALAPLRDAFTTVASIFAQMLLTRKKLEAWIIWVVVDIIALIYYFQVGVLFVGVQYCIFTLIALNGYFHWKKEYDSYANRLDNWKVPTSTFGA